MEHLPALAAEATNPARRRSNRQRNQGHESRKAHGDERALVNVFPHSRNIEGLIGAKISEEVQGDVEKSEEAKHAAEADEVGDLEQFAERRDAKSEDDETDRPITGAMLKSFHGIDAEVTADESPQQIDEGNQADHKNRDFSPFADKDCAHAECPPLMVFLQVHSVVHAGDLVAVTVEDDSGVREDFAEAALPGLAPTRMINIGIDVGVEAVFRG